MIIILLCVLAAILIGFALAKANFKRAEEAGLKTIASDVLNSDNPVDLVIKNGNLVDLPHSHHDGDHDGTHKAS